MKPELRQLVRERAEGRCEYCRMPEAYDTLPFHVDHIIAQKHHGPTDETNCAWSCFRCNSFKGANLGGLDKSTGELIRLFHPRTDNWQDHFEWHGPLLSGKTAIGIVTIDVLQINLPQRIAYRASLIEEGVLS